MKKITLPLVALMLSVHSYSQNKQSSSITEEQALEYIKDYYAFYKSDEEYTNPRVRKTSSNNFDVAIEYCSAKLACYKNEYYEGLGYITIKNDFFWSSKVIELTIKSDGKYLVKEKF